MDTSEESPEVVPEAPVVPVAEVTPDPVPAVEPEATQAVDLSGFTSCMVCGAEGVPLTVVGDQKVCEKHT